MVETDWNIYLEDKRKVIVAETIPESPFLPHPLSIYKCEGTAGSTWSVWRKE
jgi:hypothetical protein